MLAFPAALGLILCSAGETVLLDFYGDRCPPCRAMDPIVQQLIDQGYPVVRINVERQPDLARRFAVTSIPCFVMLVEGREVDRAIGQQPPQRLVQMLQRAAPAVPHPLSNQLATESRPASAAALEQPSPMSIAGAADPLRSVGGTTTPARSSGPTEASAALGALSTAGTAGSTNRRNPLPLPSSDPIDQRLLAATVRLRVVDASGISKGTGTIVDARGGYALVLTCAHIFRDSGGKGQIEVDLFGPLQGKTVAGRLIDFDLTNDVAILSIPLDAPATVARIAPEGYRVGPGDPVISCGCSHGADATLLRSRITAVDRYLNWPNLSIAGESVEGRSGGGLFTDDGLLIGVCNARDPQLREGLYSALPAVHRILDRNRLSFVYQTPPAAPSVEVRPPAIAASESGMPASAATPSLGASGGSRTNTAVAIPTAEEPRRMIADSRGAPADRVDRVGPALPAMDTDVNSLTPHEQAALQELRRRLREGAEVVCVVRPRNDPQAKSEVIVLDRVSPAFFQQLYAASRPQAPRASADSELARPSSVAPADTGMAETGAGRSAATIRPASASVAGGYKTTLPEAGPNDRRAPIAHQAIMEGDRSLVVRGQR